MTAEMGHNGGPTFDDIVRDNMDRGLLLTMKETIIAAVRDPRLDRRHIRVLAEVIDHINSASGFAYPSRKSIADATRRFEAEGVRETQGYSEAGINKTLSELVSYGYLVSTKRAVEQGGRALSIYTLRRPTTEELQDQIAAWVDAVRRGPRRSDFTYGGKVREGADVTPAGKVRGADVTPEGKVRGKVSARPGNQADYTDGGKDRRPDFTPGGNDTGADFTPVGNFTPVGKDRADFTSDFTYVVPTVTNTTELGERDNNSPAHASAQAREAPAPSAYPPGNPGEEHKGHGVYLNGETIRHATFAVSLAGIRMNTINAGLTATEVSDRCLAHALQWAVEIENGARPEKVLPSKIANFLARSIMGEVNQAKIQTVREGKAKQGYGRQMPSPDGAVETQSQRLARLAREIEQSGGGR